MNVLMMGLVRPSRANLATRMAEKAEAGIPNALSNICTVKGATLVPAAVKVERKEIVLTKLATAYGVAFCVWSPST